MYVCMNRWMDTWMEGQTYYRKFDIHLPKKIKSIWERVSVLFCSCLQWLNETQIHNRGPSSHLIYIFHFFWPCSPIHSKIPGNMTRITLKNPFSSQCNNLISSCEHGIVVSLNIMTPPSLLSNGYPTTNYIFSFKYFNDQNLSPSTLQYSRE